MIQMMLIGMDIGYKAGLDKHQEIVDTEVSNIQRRRWWQEGKS